MPRTQAIEVENELAAALAMDVDGEDEDEDEDEENARFSRVVTLLPMFKYVAFFLCCLASVALPQLISGCTCAG